MLETCGTECHEIFECVYLPQILIVELAARFYAVNLHITFEISLVDSTDLAGVGIPFQTSLTLATPIDSVLTRGPRQLKADRFENAADK